MSENILVEEKDLKKKLTQVASAFTVIEGNTVPNYDFGDGKYNVSTSFERSNTSSFITVRSMGNENDEIKGKFRDFLEDSKISVTSNKFDIEVSLDQKNLGENLERILYRVAPHYALSYSSKRALETIRLKEENSDFLNIDDNIIWSYNFLYSHKDRSNSSFKEKMKTCIRQYEISKRIGYAVKKSDLPKHAEELKEVIGDKKFNSEFQKGATSVGNTFRGTIASYAFENVKENVLSNYDRFAMERLEENANKNSSENLLNVIASSNGSLLNVFKNWPKEYPKIVKGWLEHDRKFIKNMLETSDYIMLGFLTERDCYESDFQKKLGERYKALEKFTDLFSKKDRKRYSYPSRSIRDGVKRIMVDNLTRLDNALYEKFELFESGKYVKMSFI